MPNTFRASAARAGTARILLIQDGSSDEAILSSLTDASINLRVDSLAQAWTVLATNSVDAIVLAVGPDVLPVALEQLYKQHPSLPVVVLTGGAANGQARPRGRAEYLDQSELTLASMQRAVKHVAERYRYHAAEAALGKVRRAMDSARAVQAHLFPKPPPEMNLDLFGTVYSRDVSGDFYDFLSLTDGRALIAVGDVTGHGLDAALLMASARAYLRASVQLCGCEDVGVMLGMVNALLSHDVGDERFVAMSLTCIDLQGMTMEHCSAGLPPGVLISVEGVAMELICPQHLPMGIDPESCYVSQRFPLQPEDTLLLVTDGVIEAVAKSGDTFDAPRMVQAVRRLGPATAEQTALAVIKSVQSFTGRKRQRDDLTVVALKLPA